MGTLVDTLGTISIWIAILPAILHLIDRVLEVFSPISDASLQKLMATSDEGIAKLIGSSDDNYAVVKSYINFERRCHFIVSALGFSILSLVVAQIELRHSALNWSAFTFFPMVGLTILLVIFLIMLNNRTQEPLAANPPSTRYWYWGAFAAFASVLTLEVLLHVTEAPAAAKPVISCERQFTECLREEKSRALAQPPANHPG